MGRLARNVAASVLGVLLVLALAILLLAATGPGQRALLRVAEWAASSRDLTVKIGALDGSLFSRGHFDRIEIADAKGVWAEVEDIRFDWNPWGLLQRGAVDVEKIGIGKLTVSRKPEENGGSEPVDGGDSQSGGLAVPPLRLATFAIGEAVLDEAVLGEAARLSVSARALADDPARAIAGAVTIRDLDRPSHLTADLQYSGQTGSLQVAARAEEKAGGVLSRLLEMGEGSNIRLALDGGGKIDDWRGRWSFAANGEAMAGGDLTIRRGTDGLRIAADANGEIARLLPRPYADLLAGKAAFSAEGQIVGGESYRLERLQLDAPRIRAKASGAVDLAGSGIRGDADIEIRDTGTDQPIVLTLGDGTPVALRQAHVALSARPKPDGIALSGTLDAADLAWRGNKADRVWLRLSARQLKEAAHPLERLDDISLTGEMQNPQFSEPEFRPIAGERVRLELAGSKDGERLTIGNATLSAGAGTATATGVLDASGFNGETRLSVPDAKAISQLAGRDVSGAVSVTGKGRAGFDGSLDLSIDGKGERLEAGADLIGKLLAGGAALNGTVERDGGGTLRFGALELATDSLRLKLDGSVSAEDSSVKLTSRIAELSKVLPDSSGALLVEASVEGGGDQRQVTAQFSAAEATIRGKPLRDVVLSYDGRGGFDAQAGEFSASGRIGDAPLTGGGKLEYSAVEGTRISAFTLALGGNRMEADGTLPTGGEAHGEARLHIADAGELAPILGVPLGGSAAVDLRLFGAAEAPRLTIKASSDHFRYDTIEIKAVSATLAIADAVQRPTLSGKATVGTLSAGGTQIADLELTARPEVERSAISLSARLDGRWQLAGKALLALSDWQPEAALHDISIRNGAAALAQSGRAAFSMRDGLRLNGLVLTAGKGRISADVVFAPTLSGKIEIEQFPASFADPFVPDMQPRGIVAGTVDLGGSTATPDISYKLAWSGADVAGRLPPSFPALDLSASGTFKGDVLTVGATVTGPPGLNLKAEGNVTAPGAEARLALKAGGTVPLALASPFIAARGTTLDGNANVDLAIRGTAQKPTVEGRLAASGASITDPPTGIALKGASLAARLNDGTLRIETLKARSEDGAEVTATGTLGLVGNAKMPADLQIKTAALSFDDQRTAKGSVSADVSLKGDLNGKSTLGGSLDISRLDIRIPRSLPTSVAALELKHKNAPDYILAAQPKEKVDDGPSLPSTIALSLTIRAANRIFVTGRGLDAQLGGELQLLGSADEPRAIGEFTLERGRLALLGRTLDFSSGSITFSGDLDPLLNFVATTDASGTQIDVTISGQASDPKLSFSSNPELPEDEILALLLFNKSLGELSPFQVAQLASEVGELSGIAGGPGILSGLKSGIGLDTLNITTNKDGESAVSAGSYINEKLFVGVEQGLGNDSSRVKVDLDITKNLKLRGETDADGQSKVGIGVEWNY